MHRNALNAFQIFLQQLYALHDRPCKLWLNPHADVTIFSLRGNAVCASASQCAIPHLEGTELNPSMTRAVRVEQEHS